MPRKREAGVKVDPGANWKIADNRNITHDGDGLYSYSGQGEDSEDDIGTVWTVQPLDPKGGTFEVKIVSTGERKYIAIGVCHESYPHNSLPGWKETSVAFHVDLGSLFHSSDEATPLSVLCKAGDTIRCGLSFRPGGDADSKGVSVNFYYNGSRIAQVPTSLPPGGFYGVVGMMSRGEQVQMQPLLLTQTVDFERLWTVLTPSRIAHEGGGCCAYVGRADLTQQNVGTVRTNAKVDPTSPAGNSLLVKVVEPGKHRCIALGVCSKSYPIDMLPGWDEPSVGYHADNGQVLKNNEDEGGSPTDHVWRKGDVIKCTVEPVDGSAKEVKVTFRRNGTLVGHTSIWTPEGGFYFCVGMMNPDEKVCIVLPEVVVPYAPQRLNFTDVWEVTSLVVEHQGQGKCAYTGLGGDQNVGTVRSKQPLDPFSSGKNTFGVKILCAGDHCYIAIGVCSSRYPSNIMPGWEESSIGYHADNGCIYQGTTTEHRTSHLCLVDDTMRCTVEPQDGSSKQVSVSFYKNGVEVNRVMQWSPTGGYYALVGMMSRGAVVQISTPLTDPTVVQLGRGMTPDSMLSRQLGVSSVGSPGTPSMSPDSNRTADGGTPMPSSSYFPASDYFHHHHSSFSGALPAYSPQGHSSLYPSHYLPSHPHDYSPVSPYYTRDQSLFHTQQHPPYSMQQHSPYQSRNHIPYQIHEQPSYQPQGHAYYHSPLPGPQPPLFHSVASEPNFNKSLMQDPQYNQDYPRYPHGTHDQHGPVYEQQISMPDPKRVLSGEETKELSTRRSMSTPPLSTEELSSQTHTSDTAVVNLTGGLGAAVSDTLNSEQEPVDLSITPGSPDKVSCVEGTGEVIEETGHHRKQTEKPRAEKREGQGGIREEKGVIREEKGVVREEKGVVREEKGVIREEKGVVREEKGVVREEKRGVREEKGVIREEKGVVREEKGGVREEKGVVREEKGGMKEEKGGIREEKGGIREEKGVIATQEKCDKRTETNGHVEDGGSVAARDAFGIQRLLSTSSLPDVPPLPKMSSKTFQFLHNVVTLDTGVLQCSSAMAWDIGFVMCRQPLSEKLPYYELEVNNMMEGGVVQVGLVWNGFPPRKMPGTLQGSMAYNCSSGTLHTGAASCRQVSSPCNAGDIIGCKAHLHYKQEVVHDANSGNVEMVKVEFFRNGCLLGVENVSLPPSGLFPAIGLVGQGTQVKFSRSITLSPETYFLSHPLPAGFVNFPPPPTVDASWRCLLNAKITEDGVLSQLCPHSGSSTIVQGSLPFSRSHFYCEIHLETTLNKFTTFSIGVLPKVTSLSRSTDMIPGESKNSVSLLPLLGFVMKDGGICSNIPDIITSEIKTSTLPLNIGLGMHFATMAEEGADTAEVFFTISQQQLCSITVTVPPGGMYPTIVLDTDCKAEEVTLAKLNYPSLWPSVKGLPYGFVRGSNGSNCIERMPRSILFNGDSSSVNVLQAGFPLSPTHSYYEITILSVTGDNPQLAVGVASYRHPLSVLPGMGKDSIAFYTHDGAVHEPSAGRETVVSGSTSAWLRIGCGARFKGGLKSAEVFFTVNKQIVSRRLVAVPPQGLFPTIGLQGFKGHIDLNPFASDPFPELVFGTNWRLLTNIQLSGQQLSSKIPTKLGLAQLGCAASSSTVTYFTVSLPQPVNRSSGKVFIGFSNSDDTPFGGKHMATHRSCFLDVVSGTIVWCDPSVHSDDIGSTANGRLLGCGIWQTDNNTMLLFFTMDNQVIHCAPLTGISGSMFPTLCLIDCHIKVCVDTCASWPPTSRIGKGWGRSSNLIVVNSEICHVQLQPTSSKTPVGFAQASFPLIPPRPYFEIEITSDSKKAIAVGLASREYAVNSWIGVQDNSVAYYSDSGKLYSSSSIGKDFGPRLAKGDTVGCGVTFAQNDYIGGRKGQTAEVFFTVNGAVIGRKKVSVPYGGLFPTVCLDSTTSILPSFHNKFPPTQGFVSKDWAIAYSICQVGQLIRHRGGSFTIPQGIPKAFCQATTKLCPEKPYFEIEIVNCTSTSVISMGVGIRQDHQAISLERDYLLYSSTGEIVTKNSSRKSTQMSQKFFVGDIIGCSLIYAAQLSVEFHRNGTKVCTVMLPAGSLETQPLFSIISLSHPGDTVKPRLCQPLPIWDPSTLVGWLRTERVTIRNNVIEYNSSSQQELGGVGVGVAQMSQLLAHPGIAYYELEILDTDVATLIGIGAASATYSLMRMPGWDGQSVGYHGDDGCVFRASGRGESFGPAWKRQDVIGLGIRSVSGNFEPGSEVQVYFTRNGQELGHVTMDVPPTGLFPTIGLHSKYEKVKVSTSTSGQCGNSDPRRLAWRALCGVNLHQDGRGLPVLEYCSQHYRPSPAGHQLGVAIAQQPLSNTMQYFEVDLRQFGKMKSVAIGVAPRHYSVELPCGWGSGSIGYHTDDGQLYNQSENGQVFGPIPKAGNTVGCGVSFVPNSNRHCFVFFTYNGTEIGRVRTAIPEGGFYPAVTLTSAGDKVAISYHEAFKPKLTEGEHQVIGLLRIVNCSYSNQLLHYSGNSGTDPAIAQFAVALHRESNYYCANIVNLKDTVVFGLATRDFSVKDIPGRSSVSVAYDITNGQIDAVYNMDKCFQFRAPRCSPGDMVGCGVEPSDSKAVQGYVFFTRNGLVVQKMELTCVFDDMYPIVGIRSVGNYSTLFMVWSDVQMPIPNNF